MRIGNPPSWSMTRTSATMDSSLAADWTILCVSSSHRDSHAVICIKTVVVRDILFFGFATIDLLRLSTVIIAILLPKLPYSGVFKAFIRVQCTATKKEKNFSYSIMRNCRVLYFILRYVIGRII